MRQWEQVMADIRRIRMALTERGARLQKLPKQAVWVIHCANSKSYRLTYQVAPLSGWAISPSDKESSQLLGVIERALHGHEASGQHEESSTPQPTAYQQQLHPWCVVQLLPQMQRRTVARFRKRNDADAHLRTLRQHCPIFRYVIIFDPALAKTGLGIEG